MVSGPPRTLGLRYSRMKNLRDGKTDTIKREECAVVCICLDLLESFLDGGLQIDLACCRRETRIYCYTLVQLAYSVLVVPNCSYLVSGTELLLIGGLGARGPVRDPDLVKPIDRGLG